MTKEAELDMAQTQRRRFSANSSERLVTSPLFRTAIWLAIVAAAAVRFFGPIHYDPNATVPKGPEAARVGYYLYTQGDWANPFGPLQTGPTAHEAPLYPAMLAGLYHILGAGAKGAYSVQFVEALVLTAEVGVIPLVAQALGLDLVTGFAAALLAVFGTRRTYVWETNYVGFLLVLLTLLACKYLRSLDSSGCAKLTYTTNSGATRSYPKLFAIALGLLWGTTLLTGPSTALVWVSWVILGAWYSYRHGAWKVWLPVLIIPVIMVAPWAWRNNRVLHSPVLLRSNFGLELMVSNNSCATYSMRQNQSSGCFKSTHPNWNRKEGRKVIDLGEVNYNKAKLKQALEWISENPRIFARLTAQRLLYFWLPTDTGRFAGAFTIRGNTIPAWVIYPATVLSIPGLIMLWRTSRRGAVILASFLVLYPPVYYFVQFESRYRFPIMWVTFLLGAVVISKVAGWAIDRLLATRLTGAQSEPLVG
jgi:hypothetical protein